MSDAYETRSDERDAPPPPPEERRGGGAKRFFWFLVAVLLAFGAGFGWQWWKAEEVRAELQETQARADSLELRLTFQELGNTLATAVMQATYGNYEPGRQAASEFFTGLQQRAPSAPAGQGRGLQAVLAERDATITALSRSDPESRDLLANLFIQYRRATGISASALQTTPARETDDQEPPAGESTDTTGGGGPVGTSGS